MAHDRHRPATAGRAGAGCSARRGAPADEAQPHRFRHHGAGRGRGGARPPNRCRARDGLVPDVFAEGLRGWHLADEVPVAHERRELQPAHESCHRRSVRAGLDLQAAHCLRRRRRQLHGPGPTAHHRRARVRQRFLQPRHVRQVRRRAVRVHQLTQGRTASPRRTPRSICKRASRSRATPTTTRSAPRSISARTIVPSRPRPSVSALVGSPASNFPERRRGSFPTRC